mmetsp:Transcript_9456/g.10962  ORF Transcript_9456/g.10962 Transcript_9456/m.10962 type:complete len:246 (-) Transcript_9456:260-997(-)
MSGLTDEDPLLNFRMKRSNSLDHNPHRNRTPSLTDVPNRPGRSQTLSADFPSRQARAASLEQLLLESHLEAGLPEDMPEERYVPSRGESAIRFVFDFLLALPNLVIGIYYFNRCPGIPSLVTYLLTFGIVGAIKALMTLYFKLPLSKKHADPSYVGTMIVDRFGIAYLPIGIWGACLTFGEVATRFGDGGADCAQVSFLSAFFSAVIVVSIMVFMFFYSFRQFCCGRSEMEDFNTDLLTRPITFG